MISWINLYKEKKGNSLLLKIKLLQNIKNEI